MMATSGGCVGQRGVMEVVDFGVPGGAHHQQRQQHHPSKMKNNSKHKNKKGGGTTAPNTPSRSERLNDKEALLYNSHNKARTNTHPLGGIGGASGAAAAAAAAGGGGGIVLPIRRTSRQPDADDDWGVTPTTTTIRRGAGLLSSSTPIACNKTLRTTTTTTPQQQQQQHSRHPPHSSSSAAENAAPLTSRTGGATPTERLRSFEKRNTTPFLLQKSSPSHFANSSSTNGGGRRGPLTPTSRARSLEVAATSREKQRLNQRKMQRMEEEKEQQRQHHQHQQQEVAPIVMMDITSRHYNHNTHGQQQEQSHHHQQHQQQQRQPQGPALFQSARNKASFSTPLDRKKVPTPPKAKKKSKKKGAVRLFEHSQKEYDERDRRRHQNIVHTVRSMEASNTANNNYDSGEASSSSSSNTGDEPSKYQPLIADEPQQEERRNREKEEIWDDHRYAVVEKLNAALDGPIVQDKYNHNSLGSMAVAKTSMVKTVTDWGIEAIVSDLSVTSSGAESSIPAPPTTAALAINDGGHSKPSTSRLHQALAEAKKQIYPDGLHQHCENFPPVEVTAATPRGPGEGLNYTSYCPQQSPPSIGDSREDKYITGDDTSDEFDRVSRNRLYEGRQSPMEGLQLGSDTTFQQKGQIQQTPLNVNIFEHETPKHSNTARSHSFEVNRTSSEVPTKQRARSKSPDPLVLSLGLPKRTRSRTPDGLRKHAASHQKEHDTSRHGSSSRKATMRPTHDIPATSVGSGKSWTSSLPFGRSRSATPTKDRRLLRQEGTPSTGSSQQQPRSVTPNRLWASRRGPTPGQMIINDGPFIDRVEEKLKALQQEREAGQQHSQEAFYQRPKITTRRPNNGVNTSRSFGSFDRLSVGGGAERRKPALGGIMKKGKQFNQSPNGLRNGRGRSSSSDFAGGGSAASRSTTGYDGRYSSSPRTTASPREPPSKRWFGRRREEVPEQDKFDALTSSTGSNSTRARGIAHRLSSILGGGAGGDSNAKKGQSSKEVKPAVSERMMKHMMTFDGLMKAIESDKKNSLGAEFAVVELGDEETAVQTHAILMNRDDVEDQLNARGSRHRDHSKIPLFGL